jgi:tetraacyldisaccharide 4'-kinase
VKTIHSFAPELKVLLCQNKTKGFLLSKDFFENASLPVSSPDGPVLAFCGLGNPYSFFEQLRQSGLNLVGTKSFPDHHDYRPADLTLLFSDAEEAGAEALITTAKDALKLDQKEGTIPIYVCVSEPEFDDKKGLTDQLDKAFI